CRAASPVTPSAAPRSAAVCGPRVLSSSSSLSPAGRAGVASSSGWWVDIFVPFYFPSNFLLNYRAAGEKSRGQSEPSRTKSTAGETRAACHFGGQGGRLLQSHK